MEERYVFEHAFEKGKWSGESPEKNIFEDKDYYDKLDKFVHRAIDNGLTSRQRECIVKYYFKNVPVKTIADELDIKTSTVYKHINKGKKTIKELAVYFI